VKVKLHEFLTSALDEGEWSVSCPLRFNPGERTPLYPLDRQSGPQKRSGRGGKEKNSQQDDKINEDQMVGHVARMEI